MGSYSGLGEKGAPGVNLYAEPFFQENGFTRVPVLVQWMATLRCSFSCVHCLCGDTKFSHEMTFEEVRGLIGQITELGACELLVTGGEPLERPDMPEIIRLFGESGVRWSLNTATYPNDACRSAIEAHPPSFVAVSLDGPAMVHNGIRKKDGAFNEALQSISYFSRITGGRTTAGTTVHGLNFNYLAETFPIVIESGATAWGIHLLFHEGRAAGNTDLYLKKKQLKKLLSFIASKRKYFPVGLADELGYVGEWEPLVRDNPLWCGAGRSQCVVLPDGEVVPCTTLDRSESAGNVRFKPLEEIWKNGFASIRNYTPKGKCEKCDYAPACGGGCWLQRRHGLHCFRDVWSKPRSLLTTAGLAVCLGLSACTGDNKPANEKPTTAVQTAQPTKAESENTAVLKEIGKGANEKPTSTVKVVQPTEAESESTAVLQEIGKGASVDMLEWGIARWYAKTILLKPVKDLESIRASLEEPLQKDPAGKYFIDLMKGKRPKTLEEKAETVRKCLGTNQRSLSLSSLLWRELAEWCLNAKPVDERTDTERKLMRKTIRTLKKKTDEWRLEIFHKKLDPFLHRDVIISKYYLKHKGRHPTAATGSAILVLAFEHWGDPRKSSAFKPLNLTEEYLQENPFGLSMRLNYKIIKGSGIIKVLAGNDEKITGEIVLEIFDIVKSARGADGKGTTLQFGPKGHTFDTVLPPEIELTYADILRLTYEQNKEKIDKWAERAASVHYSYQEPHLIPALHNMTKGKEKDAGSAKALVKLLEQWMF